MSVMELTTYEIGHEVDDFMLPTVGGEDVRLSDVMGRWTVLYFTTTWCPYCTAEAPFIEQELAAFEDHDVRLVIVDVKEQAEVARMLPERFGWEAPFLLDLTGEVSTMFAPKKEGLAPEVAIINAHVVLDEDRVIRYAEYLNMERFDAHVAPLVEALQELTGGDDA